jgi:hypothetical protein
LLRKLSSRMHRVERIQTGRVMDRWKIRIVFIRTKAGTVCIVWAFEEELNSLLFRKSSSWIFFVPNIDYRTAQ